MGLDTANGKEEDRKRPNGEGKHRKSQETDFNENEGSGKNCVVTNQLEKSD